jgi:copper chaperone CopZ
VGSLPGVNKDSLSVLFNASKVKVDFDESKLTVEDIQKSITTLGYEVLKTQVKDR